MKPKIKTNLRSRHAFVAESLNSYVESGVDEGLYVTHGRFVDPSGARISDMDESQRFRMKGVNVSQVTGVFPRVSVSDYRAAQAYAGKELDVEAVEVVLSKLCEPGSRDWNDFMATRAALKTPVPSGGHSYDVVHNVYPTAIGPSEKAHVRKVAKPGEKVYSLAQVFSDPYVREKYGLPEKLMRDVHILAINKPADAAATLQEAIQLRSPSLKINVITGDYNTSRTRAKSTISKMSAQAHRAHKQAAVLCHYMRDEVLVYGPDGDTGWFVRGPVEHFRAVTDVYQMAAVGGLHETAFLLQMELSVLAISLCDGDEYISSTMVGHAGTTVDELDEFDSAETMAQLSSTSRAAYSKLSRNVLPLRAGDLVASALRLSVRSVLVNQHVADVGKQLYVGVDSLCGGMPLSEDTCHFFYEDERYETWVLRPARVGEWAACIYHNGNRPVISSPFQVDKISGADIFSVKNGQLARGMSGGAVVALSDMCLLGMHSGQTHTHWRSLAVSSNLFMDIMELEAERDPAMRTEAANSVYDEFAKRGLRHVVDSVLNAVQPLYGVDDDHKGMALTCGAVSRTTLPSGEYRYAPGATLVEYSTDTGFVSAREVVDARVAPTLMREPNLYERVIVVGKDGEGHYFSEEMTVGQVMPARRGFCLTGVKPGLPLFGGVVVSMVDGAVIGMYVRATSGVALGQMAYCQSLPLVESVVQDVVHAVKVKFPTLSVAGWNFDVLRRLFVHASVDVEHKHQRKLAALGMAVMRERITLSMYEAGLSLDVYQQYIDARLSRTRCASMSWELGIAQYLRTQDGMVLPATSDAYSALFSAFVGVVFLNEDTATLDGFLASIGVVPSVREFQDGCPVEAPRFVYPAASAPVTPA